MSWKRSKLTDEQIYMVRDQFMHGWGCADIAVKLGISYSTVWGVLHTAGLVRCGLYRKVVPPPRLRTVKAEIRGIALGDANARKAVEKAIRKGWLKRPDHCSECGKQPVTTAGRIQLHAHHDDYFRPLDVRWLCPTCHARWHVDNVPRNMMLIEDWLDEPLDIRGQ